MTGLVRRFRSVAQFHSGVQKLENKTFVVLSGIVKVAFGRALWPLFGAVFWAVFWAVSTAIVFHPLCHRLLPRMKGRRNVAEARMMFSSPWRKNPSWQVSPPQFQMAAKVAGLSKPRSRKRFPPMGWPRPCSPVSSRVMAGDAPAADANVAEDFLLRDGISAARSFSRPVHAAKWWDLS